MWKTFGNHIRYPSFSVEDRRLTAPSVRSIDHDRGFFTEYFHSFVICENNRCYPMHVSLSKIPKPIKYTIMWRADNGGFFQCAMFIDVVFFLRPLMIFVVFPPFWRPILNYVTVEVEFLTILWFRMFYFAKKSDSLHCISSNWRVQICVENSIFYKCMRS